MSKVDGRFKFSPISVNFLTEVAKVIFAIVMLIIQVVLFSFVSRTQENVVCFYISLINKKKKVELQLL